MPKPRVAAAHCGEYTHRCEFTCEHPNRVIHAHTQAWAALAPPYVIRRNHHARLALKLGHSGYGVSPMQRFRCCFWRMKFMGKILLSSLHALAYEASRGLLAVARCFHIVVHCATTLPSACHIASRVEWEWRAPYCLNDE